MKNNNIIRFLGSLILLPTVSMPLGSIPIDSGVSTYPQIVLSQKNNIEANGLLAFNQAPEEPKADLGVQILKAQAEAIDAYFSARKMPLEGTGLKMAEEAEKNDIDWRLLPAIAVRESTGGKFACIKVANNPFGWGSCKIGFKSIEAAIETVAKNLGGNNPNTARYYEDKTLMQVLRAYNPPSIVPKYAEQVMAIMKVIGNEDIMAVPTVAIK